MGRFKVMGLICFIICMAFSPYSFSSTTLNIHLSPRGDDSLDGSTATKAVLSLKRAHQIVSSHFKKTPSDVNILIAAGTYYNQTIIWTATHPQYKIRIHSSSSQKPIFDGRGSATSSLGNQRSFFILKSSSGATNLILENLSVRFYAEAVSFNGDRDNEKSGFNSHNKILFMTFDKIGSKYHVDQNSPAYAGVRLLNSRFNEIKGNTFTNIVNHTRPELLHAIYVAHFSHENTFEGNVFRKSAGDPLRVRDFSNFNMITKNEFDSAGPYAYSEWYCEKAESNACTKTTPECPSWGSIMRSNIYRGSKLFHYYVRPNFQNSTSACKTPAPVKADSRRLRTALNVSTNESVVHSNLNDENQYGICPSRTHCVTTSGSCYADGKGTINHICVNSSWLNRADIQTPFKTEKGYLIQSRLNKNINSGYCPRSTDCVSTGGFCYANSGGTTNHLCVNNHWKSR